jgi:hypothetical protein
MSVLDFLFEGKPPKSVTTYGTATKDIPQWMSDYTQGLVAKANAVAAEPYQQYSGPRVAGFTGDQSTAFDLTRGNVGVANPYIGKAGQYAEAAGNTSPLATAAPYMNSAGKNWTDPGVAESYMNPYMENVFNRNEQLAMRNLNENFIPGLQDAFTSGGSFGGTRMEELGIRGTRDIAEGLNAQNNAALAAAYGQGADIFGSDANRQGNLATVAGNLATSGADIGLKSAEAMGSLGQIAQKTGLTDAAAMEAIGAQQQQQGQKSLDTAYADFDAQRDYPRDTINWMNSVVKGIPYSETVNEARTGPSPVYQPSPLNQLAAAGSAIYGVNQATKQRRGGLIQARRHLYGR